jgi:hypothetical protein
MQYVLRNKNAIGFILSSAKGYRAFDADGQPIGLFADPDLAARAVYERASKEVDRLLTQSEK